MLSGMRYRIGPFLTLLALTLVSCAEPDPRVVAQLTCVRAVGSKFHGKDVRVYNIKEEFGTAAIVARAHLVLPSGERFSVDCRVEQGGEKVTDVSRVPVSREMASAIRDLNVDAVKNFLDFGYCRERNCSSEIVRAIAVTPRGEEQILKAHLILKALLDTNMLLPAIDNRESLAEEGSGAHLFGYNLTAKADFSEIEMLFEHANVDPSVFEAYLEEIVGTYPFNEPGEDPKPILTDEESVRLLQIAEHRGVSLSKVSTRVVDGAVSNNKPKSLDYLLSKGAPFDRDTILFSYASATPVSDYIFERLISAGANPRAKNDDGLNALEWALYLLRWRGRDELVFQFNSVDVFANRVRIEKVTSSDRESEREGCKRLAQKWNKAFLKGLAGESIAPSEDVQVPTFCRKYLE